MIQLLVYGPPILAALGVFVWIKRSPRTADPVPHSHSWRGDDGD